MDAEPFSLDGSDSPQIVDCVFSPWRHLKKCPFTPQLHPIFGVRGVTKGPCQQERFGSDLQLHIFSVCLY